MKKNKLLSIILILVMMLPLVSMNASGTDEKNYKDVRSTDWFYDGVKFVTSNDLFYGTGDEKFSPNLGMTRGMLLTVLGRKSSVNVQDYDYPSVFLDVSDNQYYSPYLNWALENKIVQGVGGNLFEPDREMTREEMITILYQYALRTGNASLGYDTGNTDLKEHYTDSDKISPWARRAAMWARIIIQGEVEGRFDPDKKTSRAQVAHILIKAIQEEHLMMNSKLVDENIIEPHTPIIFDGWRMELTNESHEGVFWTNIYGEEFEIPDSPTYLGFGFGMWNNSSKMRNFMTYNNVVSVVLRHQDGSTYEAISDKKDLGVGFPFTIENIYDVDFNADEANSVMMVFEIKDKALTRYNFEKFVIEISNGTEIIKFQIRG